MMNDNIDKRIKKVIEVYNHYGYITECSCEGHWNSLESYHLDLPGAITYIEFEFRTILYDRLMEDKEAIASFFPLSSIEVMINVLDEGEEDEEALIKLVINHSDDKFKTEEEFFFYLEKGMALWSNFLKKDKHA